MKIFTPERAGRTPQRLFTPARGRPGRRVSPADGYAWTIPPKPRSSTRIRTLLMIMPVQHGSPLTREMIKPD